MVVLMGGEPGLVADLTHRLAAAIAALGIAVRVETNASWAVNDDAARRFLKPLYACGALVMFSLDAWHKDLVPPERVTRAVLVSEALGGSYCLESAYLDYPGCEHEFDQLSNRLLADLRASWAKKSRSATAGPSCTTAGRRKSWPPWCPRAAASRL